MVFITGFLLGSYMYLKIAQHESNRVTGSTLDLKVNNYFFLVDAS